MFHMFFQKVKDRDVCSTKCFVVLRSHTCKGDRSLIMSLKDCPLRMSLLKEVGVGKEVLKSFFRGYRESAAYLVEKIIMLYAGKRC